MKKINNSKKAQLSQTAVLIIILVSAIVLLLFITKFVSKATFDEAITACRFSVMAQVASEIKPGLTGAKSPLDINCEKRYVTFYNTKVELGLSPENMKTRSITIAGKKVKRFSTLTDSTVNQVIAEELRTCKFQFADGKVEIFANDDIFFGEQTVCFICSELTFEKKITKQSFNTLVDYTKKTTFDNTGVSYYDYLTTQTISNNTMWSQPLSEPKWVDKSYFSSDNYQSYTNLTIDTSKKYVVFVEKFKSGKANLFVWGRPVWVAVVPADQINRYCDIQGS